VKAALAALVVAVGVLALGGQAVAIGGIHAYQHTLAPAAAHLGIRCRFTPTCNRYSEAVIARDGLVRGGWKAVKRIARCGPWTRAGTIDVP
jgi:uncharacterized protein